MHSYLRIGDVDNNENNSSAWKYFRNPLIILILIICAITMVVGFFFLTVVSPLSTNIEVVILQTSQFHRDKLRELDSIELTKRGFDVDSSKFNPNRNIATDVSHLRIDSDVTYQVYYYYFQFHYSNNQYFYTNFFRK